MKTILIDISIDLKGRAVSKMIVRGFNFNKSSDRDKMMTVLSGLIVKYFFKKAKERTIKSRKVRKR